MRQVSDVLPTASHWSLSSSALQAGIPRSILMVMG